MIRNTLIVSSATLLAAVSLGLPSAQAQNGEVRRIQAEKAIGEEASTPLLITHDRIVGAKLAGVLTDPKSLRATLGEIEDLVVDRKHGEIRMVVLAPSSEDPDADTDRRVAIPWAQIERDPKTGWFSTKLTEAQIQQLPAFDGAMLGAPAAEASTDGKGVKGDAPKNAAATATKSVTGAQDGTMIAPATYVLASEVIRCGVDAKGTDADSTVALGDVATLYVEPGAGLVCLVTVTRDPAPLLVPWSALTAKQANADADAAALCIDRSLEDLDENAPRLQHADGGLDPSKQADRLEVYAFWSVAPPVFDRAARTDQDG